VNTIALAESRSEILAALRKLGGRGTVGDVVAESGLSGDEVRSGLKTLLGSHRGHLAVSDSGELIYDFESKLIERGSDPLLARLRRSAGTLARGVFQGWIVVMLVGYFVAFVALVIAALLAGQRGNDSRGGWGGGRHRHGLPIDPVLLYWIWGPRWRIGRPYYGHRWERTLAEDDRVPFYKKVFAFVFGPDRPSPTPLQRDRAKLRLIRSRGGVLTTAELVEHSGDTFDEASEDMARLLGQYDGEVVVSPNGELVYAFPQVMASVKGTRAIRAPNPAWLRLEPEKELTGNTAGTNALVAGMNGFTLVASATAPWFIFPRLGIGGPAAFIGLVLVPLVYSVLFFGTPLVRRVALGFENRRRRRRNVRRVLLGMVYERALSDHGISVRSATAFVDDRLKEQGPVESSEVRRLLEQLAAELDADVTVGEDGDPTYRFQAIPNQLRASEVMRRTLALDQRRLGEVVFSTADTPDEADARDLALFDRDLLGKEVDLGAYLPSTDGIGFEDDFELVAFDEGLRS
jgi:hypothetical protein